MSGLGFSLLPIALMGGGAPPPVPRAVALISPTTGAAWVTPDGKMLVIMKEAG